MCYKYWYGWNKPNNGFCLQTELGKNPCKLCVEQNPEYKGCIEDANKIPYRNNLNLENLTFSGSQVH